MIKTLFLAAMATMIFSCSGEDGRDGAQGEQGIQGEQGPQGPQGPQGNPGTPGQPGTANVVSSTWVNYDWNTTNTPTSKSMEYNIPAAILTATGYNSLYNFSNAGGVILVYGKNWGSNSVFLFNYEFRNARYRATPNTNGSKIFLYINSINGSALSDTEYDSARGNQFRYVLIPAGTQIAGKPAKPLTQLTWEEVKALYKLED